MKKNNVKIIVIVFICLFVYSVCVQQLEYCFIKNNIKKLGMDKGYDNISVVKTFKGRLTEEKEKKIISTIIENMGGRIVYNQKNDEQRKIYAYSPVLKNVIIHNNKRINLNIIITYMKDLNVSNVYIGAPIVNIDY
jgi:hypothetical protein